MSRYREISWSLLFIGVLCTIGCNVGTQVEVVDLNKALDALTTVLDETDSQNGGETSAAGDGIAAVAAHEEDAAKQKEFLTRYAAKLNAMNLTQSPIGVTMNSDGSIEGFTDANKNMVKDASDKKLFTVQIDAEQNRLIASDTNNYHRDHAYRPRMGGLFTGYMLGSMLGRQNSFYSSQPRPKFDSMKMSPKNYHSSAVSAARSKARTTSSRSARSRSGSRGFSFGK